ncbi:MAG: IMS domain-containing protein [Cyanobium sp.]
MDLPIDHFRLLGVSASSDAQTVLRTLQQRLDRPPIEGYTADTLVSRAELLRASADLLSDEPRRAAYEADLTALVGAGAHVVPALEIPTSKEVGGLLLLLEGGQPQEAFELACRGLQPPQAPALGSGREADLTLIAGMAALAASAEFQQQRRFERAARMLQQGQQLLQRTGQRPDLRERLHGELERLTPYRVLDLLNRDLGAVEERREGLALLEQLVERRGGLEGESDPSFPPEEFRTFFKQIRSLLTVQEQVDLFSRWGDAGSPAADFLASTALAASGFAQRKPERIAEARERLLASERPGIEPLLASLSLLLGEVDTARASFEAGASRELRSWTERQSSDPLGQLCAWCRDWLSRDVLPGYRDLEADADLDAYFSDRDVVAYVEREDRISGRSYAPASMGEAAAPVGASEPSPTADSKANDAFHWNFPPLDFGSGPLSPPPGSGNAAGITEAAHGEGEEEEEAGLGWSLPQLPRLPRLPRLSKTQLSRPQLSLPWLAGAAALLAALALAGSWLLRPRPPRPPAIGVIEAPAPTKPAPNQPAPPAAGPPASSAGAATTVPLTAAQPSEAQVKVLLERWLAAKATVLGGGTMPAGIDSFARPEQVSRLANERSADSVRGESQKIEVTVTNLTLDQTSPGRIAATAELRYSDSRRTADGAVLDRTPEKTIRNVYVFGRDEGRWRFAAQRPAP